MAQPGTAATASVHTNTIAGTIILRTFINAPLRGFTVRLTSINRALFPFLLKNNLGPDPNCALRLYRSNPNANEIQTLPSRLRPPASRPLPPACHATVSPPQSPH